MSIKHGMLALLRDRPGYGYQLRAAFEENTGSTWPVNIGSRGERPRDERAMKPRIRCASLFPGSTSA